MSRSKPILFICVLSLLLAACTAQTSSLSAGVQASQKPAVIEHASPTAVASATPVPPTATPTIAASVPKTVSDSCPITRPQNPVFTPPPPWPPQAPYGEFWYGTEDLWTSLHPDGTWQALPRDTAGYSQKVWFWKKGYNGRDEPDPKLTVTGRRLDGSAPPLVALDATNGYSGDFNWAMLVGVDIPTLGCWEITGHIGGHELSFVVWVAP